MQNLGLTIPNEFKIAASYALSHKFNDLVMHSGGFVDPAILQQAFDINYEAKKMDILLDKTPSNKIFAKKILQNINRLSQSFESQQAEVLLEMFDNIEKLELEIDISEAQNIYFNRIFVKINDILNNLSKNTKSKDKEFVNMLLDIGTKLNINTEFYRNKLSDTVKA